MCEDSKTGVLAGEFVSDLELGEGYTRDVVVLTLEMVVSGALVLDMRGEYIEVVYGSVVAEKLAVSPTLVLGVVATPGELGVMCNDVRVEVMGWDASMEAEKVFNVRVDCSDDGRGVG